MKLILFSVLSDYPQVTRLGVIEDDKVVDLAANYRAYLLEEKICDINLIYEVANLHLPNDMKKFLEGGKISMEAAESALEFTKTSGELIVNGEKLTYVLDEVKLHAPINNPPTIRDFLSFEEHYKNSLGGEVPPVWYELPIYYKTVASTLLGPEEVCTWPTYSNIMDYELEFACVIGKRGENIPIEKASEYIAGYMIYNDFSARDTQLKEMQGRLGPAKGKDFGTAIGPYLVTPDELSDVYDMEMIARVNGEVWSRGNTNTMHRSFEELIVYVSQHEPLVPGDIFGSGTVGNGCGLELGKYLKDGDVIELEVGSLGVLRNKIVGNTKEKI